MKSLIIVGLFLFGVCFMNSAYAEEGEAVPEAPKKAKKKSKPQKSVKATILKTIKKNKDGINTKDLQQQTGFTGKQISNNMFH
jgi:hypothetical protein